MTTNEIDKLSIDDLVQALEKKIIAVYKMRKPQRQNFFSSLPSKPDELSAVQQLIYDTVKKGIHHLDIDAKEQIRRTKRFKSMPGRFPSPARDNIEELIYSRIIMGYLFMPHGNKGQRLKRSLNKYQPNTKYLDYMISMASIDKLGQENFKHLCKVGCPQATNEWMFVHDLCSNPNISRVVIDKSKELLAEYGY